MSRKPWTHRGIHIQPHGRSWFAEVGGIPCSAGTKSEIANQIDVLMRDAERAEATHKKVARNEWIHDVERTDRELDLAGNPTPWVEVWR